MAYVIDEIAATRAAKFTVKKRKKLYVREKQFSRSMYVISTIDETEGALVE